MNDGFALFRYWGAKRTVYHLINTGKIEPIIVIGIDNAAGSNNNINERTNEYLPYPDELFGMKVGFIKDSCIGCFPIAQTD